jgi:hypothetical protein
MPEIYAKKCISYSHPTYLKFHHLKEKFVQDFKFFYPIGTMSVQVDLITYLSRLCSFHRQQSSLPTVLILEFAFEIWNIKLCTTH